MGVPAGGREEVGWKEWEGRVREGRGGGKEGKGGRGGRCLG